ncbi:MGMT family protein [Utexia brackfieldae]|uniref:MGMT family protein n=1 Tax=Utexia brackfieldae TaxID=3074108 RepID=UPI00370D71D4
MTSAPFDLEPAARVYLVISQIPPGSVASYGQIAEMAGLPRAARFVGQVLKKLPSDSTLPWHRVINHKGGCALIGNRQQVQHDKLLAEGVLFRANGLVDLKKYGWRG